jgi:hypothetical protein
MLATAILLFTLNVFSSVASDNDVTPPKLIKWSITPTIVYVNIAPTLITATVWFSDETGLTDGIINGVSVNASSIRLTNGYRGKSIELKPGDNGNIISGTAKNGVYQGVFYASASDIGEWELDFYGKDKLGNSTHYNLYHEGFYSGTVPVYPTSIVITSNLNYKYFPLLLK